MIDTYGLGGELKVQPYLEASHWPSLKKVFLKRKGGDYVPFEVRSLRRHGGGEIILRFEGCESIAHAERFKGAKLFLPKEELPRKARGEYYYYELEGLEVFTEKGKFMGRVTGVVEQKPYDLLEVEGGKLYIPFVRRLVKRVKLREGKLIVDRLLEEL